MHGQVNLVYTVQRQPPIYPNGHGSNSGTNVPGMVSEGTLIYPAVYASQPGVRDPQTPEVWEQWASAQLPPRVKDFALRVLWHK